MGDLIPDTHLDHQEQAPVSEEVLVVEKHPVLKEELHFRRRVEAKATEVPVTLRKQRAIVERLAPEPLDPKEEIPR